MTNRRTVDMTKGGPLKLVLLFALPTLLANLGQQFYQIADAAIVGRCIGVGALAAVGSADWSYWLILWAVMGLTQGFSTFVARYFGRGDHVLMNRSIAMSTLLCGVLGVVLTIVGVVAAKPLLVLLGTPAEILADATTYLVVLSFGALVVSAYNMASAILRAFGDGRSPLRAMALAAAVNIGLDLVFVLVFGWGVFGVALASVVAQAVSFLYCVHRVAAIDCVRLTLRDWTLDWGMIGDLLRLGLPLAVQNMMIALGGIVLQSAINAQGSVFVAGFTATNKLYGLLECTSMSVGLAFATYFAQNYGAERFDRFREGIRLGVKVSFVIAPVLMVVFWAAGRFLLRAFIDEGEGGGVEALAIAGRYLAVMVIWQIFLYLIHIYRNALLAIGDSVGPMVSGFAETAVRMLVALVGVGSFGAVLLFYVEPMAWVVAFVFMVVPYYYQSGKLFRRALQ